MKHRIVFVLPGGGLRGTIQAYALQRIEERLNKKISEVADLLVCSSAGSVIGGSIAAGVAASFIALKLYTRNKLYFPSRSIVLNFLRMLFLGKKSIYDRQIIIDDLKSAGADIALSEAKCLYTACSIDVNANLPRFFKSDDADAPSRRLLDVIANSFAAPYYFGMRNDDKDRVTYSDPGTGVENNPVMSAFIEVLARGWHENKDKPEEKCKVTMYVIGTGTSHTYTPYDETSRYGLASEAKAVYMAGSTQSETVNTDQTLFLDKLFDSIDIQIHNPTIPSGFGGFANTSAVDFYKETGLSIGDTIDLSPIEEKLNA
jgi:hypothetical protein